MNDGDSPFLKVQNVVKRFGGLVANNKVSLQIEKGEIRGLIGPNGAGKTTCFGVVGGLLQPDAGNVDVLGAGTFDPNGTPAGWACCPRTASCRRRTGRRSSSTTPVGAIR